MLIFSHSFLCFHPKRIPPRHEGHSQKLPALNNLRTGGLPLPSPHPWCDVGADPPFNKVNQFFMASYQTHFGTSSEFLVERFQISKHSNEVHRVWVLYNMHNYMRISYVYIPNYIIVMMKTRVLTTIKIRTWICTYIIIQYVWTLLCKQKKAGKSSWIHESIGDLSRRLPSHESIILNYQWLVGSIPMKSWSWQFS